MNAAISAFRSKLIKSDTSPSALTVDVKFDETCADFRVISAFRSKLIKSDTSPSALTVDVKFDEICADFRVSGRDPDHGHENQRKFHGAVSAHGNVPGLISFA